jgi:hypothetical protein
VHARVFGICLGGALEVFARLCEVPLLQVGLAQTTACACVVGLGLEDFLKFGDCFVVIVERVQMNIGQYSVAVGGAQRFGQVVFADNVGWSGNGIVLKLAGTYIIAQHLIKLIGAEAEDLLNGLVDRRFRSIFNPK